MTLYSTLVIGAGGFSARVVQDTVRLMHAFRSPARHVTALGVYSDGNLQAVHLPEHGALTDPPSVAADWLFRVRSQKNIDMAQAEGVSIGPTGGYIVPRVLVLVDIDAIGALSQMVQMIDTAATFLSEPVPVRLYVLVVCPKVIAGATQQVESAVCALNGNKRVSFVASGLIGLTRSDGSTITAKDLSVSLPYLLFAALEPADYPAEHWLFLPPSPQRQPTRIFGYRLITIPLPEIEEALSSGFAADVLQELTQEVEELPEVPRDLMPDEQRWWQRLLGAVPEVARAGAGMIAVASDAPPPVGKDPRNWLAEVDDWDARWHREQLPRWRDSLQQLIDELLQGFQNTLKSVAQDNLLAARAALPILKYILEKASTAVQQWSILKADLKDLDTEGLRLAREGFERALNNFLSIKDIAIPALIGTTAGWIVMGTTVTFAAPYLGGWVLPAVVASAGLPPSAAAGWFGANYRRRKREMLDAWNLYLQRLQSYHSALLQLTAQRALQQAAITLQTIVESEQSRVVSLIETIDARRLALQAVAMGFRMLTPPPIRWAVTCWEHLEPLAQQLWRQRDLPKVLSRLFERLGVSGVADLNSRVDDVEKALREMLVKRWMQAEHRSLLYYLRLRFGSDEAVQRWVREQLEEARHEAVVLSWHSERPALHVYKLLLEGVPIRDGYRPVAPCTEEVHVLPNLFGRISIGYAEVD